MHRRARAAAKVRKTPFFDLETSTRSSSPEAQRMAALVFAAPITGSLGADNHNGDDDGASRAAASRKICTRSQLAASTGASARNRKRSASVRFGGRVFGANQHARRVRDQRQRQWQRTRTRTSCRRCCCPRWRCQGTGTQGDAANEEPSIASAVPHLPPSRGSVRPTRAGARPHRLRQTARPPVARWEWNKGAVGVRSAGFDICKRVMGGVMGRNKGLLERNENVWKKMERPKLCTSVFHECCNG